MDKVEVSVVVLTYKPDWNKLRSTLKSIVMQKEVSFEIIVTDDGSERDYCEEIKNYMADAGFNRCVYNKNEKNVGTIKNYLSGIKRAKGQYIYGISPGDMLYGDMCLRKMVDFCVEKEARICFGNALYYKNDENGFKVFKGINHPKRPLFYREKMPFFIMKSMFFCNENILGASYMWKKECVLECFEKISHSALYMEDKCGTAVAIMKGIRIFHFDENVLWYETGTGVSALGNTEWNLKIQKDYTNTIYSLKKEYKRERILDAVYIRQACNNKFKKMIILTFKHPMFMIYNLVVKLVKIRYTDESEKLQKELEQYLK